MTDEHGGNCNTTYICVYQTRKEMKTMEKEKLLKLLKEAIKENNDALDALSGKDNELLYVLPSKAFYAIEWAIDYLESEEQNNELQ